VADGFWERERRLADLGEFLPIISHEVPPGWLKMSCHLHGLQEWEHQLRSSLHPALFAAVYIVVDSIMYCIPFAYVIRPYVLLGAPKVVQAVFAAAGDYFTWQLAVKVYGADSNVSWFAVCFFISSMISHELPC
jgi:hypothetical protein